MLAMQFGMASDPLAGVARMAGFAEQVGWDAGVEHALQMTLGIPNEETLYAVRYSSEGDSRSLYHSKDVQA